MNTGRFAVLLGLALLLSGLRPPCARAEAQRTTFGSAHLAYSAVDDQLNVGLVFHGFDLGGRVGQRFALGPNELSWAVHLGVGAMWSRGMMLLDLHTRPVDLAYMWRVVDRDYKLWLGPGLGASYRYYLNPTLNSGHFYWHTHYDVELRSAATFRLWDHDFRAELGFNVLTLASRPAPNPDPYFYTFNVGELLANAHSNMQVGSLPRFPSVHLSLDWQLPGRSMSLGYVFLYQGYSPDPSLHTVQHQVRFTWH